METCEAVEAWRHAFVNFAGDDGDCVCSPLHEIQTVPVYELNS
jgi:hypothetical protein